MEISENELKLRWKKKRKAIYTLKDNLERLRNKVTKDLNSENEKEKLLATIVKIMLNTSERVGNKGSSKNGRFGVSQFRKKHVKVSGSLVELNYVGKSGVEHSKVFKDAKVANILKKKKDEKGIYLFCTTSGLKISPEMVNRYLAFFDITSKDIRGFNANNMVIKELKKKGLVKELKERKKVFNEIVSKISDKIGHTKATLRGQYLLPEIEESFYRMGKVSNSIKI
jgi:DNA topoisomerase-1